MTDLIPTTAVEPYQALAICVYLRQPVEEGKGDGVTQGTIWYILSRTTWK